MFKESDGQLTISRRKLLKLVPMLLVSGGCFKAGSKIDENGPNDEIRLKTRELIDQFDSIIKIIDKDPAIADLFVIQTEDHQTVLVHQDDYRSIVVTSCLSSREDRRQSFELREDKVLRIAIVNDDRFANGETEIELSSMEIENLKKFLIESYRDRREPTPKDRHKRICR